MHFCSEELFALLSVLPFVGIFWQRLHGWYHRVRCPHPMPTERERLIKDLAKGIEENTSYRSFARQLRRGHPAFASLLNRCAQELKLSERDIADMYTVSFPTVRRWRDGSSSPTPGMRALVYRDLMALLQVPQERQAGG